MPESVTAALLLLAALSASVAGISTKSKNQPGPK